MEHRRNVGASACVVALPFGGDVSARQIALNWSGSIALWSHSIPFPFSQTLLDCPSKAFSIGLLNNANAPTNIWTCPPLPPNTAFTTSVPSEKTRNNDLLHPEECSSLCCCSPPGSLPPTFLIWTKWKFLSLWKKLHFQSCMQEYTQPFFTHS